MATDLRLPAPRTPGYTCEEERATGQHRPRLTPLTPASRTNNTGLSQVLVQVCLEPGLRAGPAGTHAVENVPKFPSASLSLEIQSRKENPSYMPNLEDVYLGSARRSATLESN